MLNAANLNVIAYSPVLPDMIGADLRLFRDGGRRSRIAVGWQSLSPSSGRKNRRISIR